MMEYQGLEYQEDGLQIDLEELKDRSLKPQLDDDPTTFDGQRLSNEVPIANDEVVPTSVVEADAGMNIPKRVLTQYPSDIIDCNGLTIPSTCVGELLCGTIYKANIYGTVLRGGKVKFFTYDVGHATFGTPMQNRSLCVDPSISEDDVNDHTINGVIYDFQPNRPTIRLTDLEQQVVTALVLHKVDGRDMYKILKGTVLELSAGQKFIRQPDGSWLFNNEPVRLQSLLEALCQPS